MRAGGARGQRRGAARAGVGRARRPVHQRRSRRRHDAAPQARRPADPAHRPAHRLPLRQPRPQLQLHSRSRLHLHPHRRLRRRNRVTSLSARRRALLALLVAAAIGAVAVGWTILLVDTRAVLRQRLRDMRFEHVAQRGGRLPAKAVGPGSRLGRTDRRRRPDHRRGRDPRPLGAAPGRRDGRHRRTDSARPAWACGCARPAPATRPGAWPTRSTRMLDRVAEGYEAQRRFAANASHELRTPLATQRALIEVSLGAALGPEQLELLTRQLLATNERNEALIEGLLTLAETERGVISAGRQRLDVIAADAVDLYRPAATRAHVRLETQLKPIEIVGELPLLERLAGNLVHNAIKYNVPDGHVSVSVEPPGRPHRHQHRSARPTRTNPGTVRGLPPSGRRTPLVRRRSRPGPDHRALDRRRAPRFDRRPSQPRRRPNRSRNPPRPRRLIRPIRNPASPDQLTSQSVSSCRSRSPTPAGDALRAGCPR